MIEVTTDGPAGTQHLAAKIAPLLEPGDVILLDGDLGAGKTTFTQGLAAALGVAEPVTSPTFTLVRSYPTERRFDLLHVDVYRLETLHEITDLALPEQLEDGDVAVIEWGERATAALPADYLQIRLALTDEPAERRITVNAVGATWPDRLQQLTAALP